MITILMYTAITVIAVCTLTALLASVADIYARRKYRLPAPSALIKRPPKSAHALTVLLFHTSPSATLLTLRSLKKSRFITPRIVIVSSTSTQHELPELRKYLKRQKNTDVRIYGTRTPGDRADAIQKAYRHTTAHTPVFVINGGDSIDPQTIQSALSLAEIKGLRRIHLSRQVHAGASFYEHTVAVLAATGQLMERIHQLLPYSSRHLPSGTLLLNPKNHTSRGIYVPYLSLAGPSLSTTRNLTTLLGLMTVSLTLFGILLFTALQAALLHSTQPLLLFLLLIAFATYIIVSWSQTMRSKDKWQLYAFIPISGVVLPIGFVILNCYELLIRTFLTLKRRYIRRNADRGRDQRNILDNILPLKTRH